MQAGALSNTYISLDGTNSYLSFVDKLWYKGGVSVEMTLHCSFTGWPSGTTTIFGKDTVGARLEISSAGVPTFVSVRSGGSKTVTGTALVRGQEYIITGKDDGTTVTLYVNGVIVGTQTASASGLLTTDTNPFYVGRDVADVVNVNMRVYGFQMRLDGEVVGRWQPKLQLTGSVPDLSQYANDATITGTVTSQFFLASAWNDEPAWVGRTNI